MTFLSIILFSSVFIMLLLMENILVIENSKMPTNYKKYKNKYNFIFAIILFSIAALRSPYTGMDTSGYYIMYNKMVHDNNALGYYLSQFITAIKEGTYIDSFGWDFCNKLLSLIIKDGQLWLALLSAIFIVSVYITIKRHSADPVISWAYILSIFIYTFILQGLRQSIAMSIILLSLKYIYNRDLLKFILLVALATLFHQSAIIFLIAYPLYNLKVSKLYFWIIGISFAAARIIPSVVIALLSRFAGDSRFAGYLEGRSNMYSVTGFFVLFAIFTFCYLHKKETLKADQKNQLLYTLSMVSLVLQSSVGIIAEMFRVSYYFSMFNMLLVANVCDSIVDRKKSRIIKYSMIIIFALYFFVSGGFEYKFFWQ